MINNRRNRIDILNITGHDLCYKEDYQLLIELGILTVREGIRWSVVERQPYVYDFSEVIQRINAAKEAGIQQLWDICHFGYPDGLDPTHPEFCNRFVSICVAFTKMYRQCTSDPLIVTPINEISFLSWLSGDVEGTVPYLRGNAGRIKYSLCNAAIQGIIAIKTIDPTAKILMVEPLIRVHANEESLPDIRSEEYNEGQFEAMDMITGLLNPELGGRPEYMDFAGFNHYYRNHWEQSGRYICWTSERTKIDFPYWLKAAADRYGKPVVITETGHFKEDRGLWMQLLTEDCITAMQLGVDLRGICIYPVIDRPDWDDLSYIACGIWGFDEHTKSRYVEADYYAEVKDCMEKMGKFLRGKVKQHEPSSSTSI